MITSPAASPFSVRSTASFVSVQIPSPRSTGIELMTVPSTITGDFRTSCSSVGNTIVVAEAATADNKKTHVCQYTLKCFDIDISPSWDGPFPTYAGGKPGWERGGSLESYSA